MVAPPLYVDSGEIQGQGVGQHEESLRQLSVEDALSRNQLLRSHSEQPPQDRVDTPLLHQPEGCEEGLVQVEVALRDGLHGGIQTVDNRVYQAVAEAERCRCKHVQDGGR